MMLMNLNVKTAIRPVRDSGAIQVGLDALKSLGVGSMIHGSLSITLVVTTVFLITDN
ncbi:MAG TPA: hypothetical protein VLA39_03075 [Marinobacterium sp.]|nr:hypothetical protein [Marinobacterium sp.]